MKALALKPENRYGSVKLLRDDVRNYLSGFSTSAENAGLIKQASLFYKRNRAACLVALLATGMIIITTGIFIGKQQNSIIEIQRARDLAETKRHEAEVASDRYREELTRNMRLMGSLSGDLEQESYELSRSFIYSDPVKAIELSIQRLELLVQKDPSAEVSSQIGYALFIKQDYAGANKYFDPSNEKYEDILNVSTKYEKIKVDEILTPEQLAELIGDLKAYEYHRKPLIEKVLVYDYAIRVDKTEYGSAVHATLAKWNHRWTEGRFEYDSHNASLLVRGNQLKVWAIVSSDTSGESPLRFLSITTLDARETGLHDLNQIKTLPLKTLDIRDTNVTDLKPIRLFSSLRMLTVGQDQFTAAQLAQLPKTLKISIR